MTYDINEIDAELAKRGVNPRDANSLQESIYNQTQRIPPDYQENPFVSAIGGFNTGVERIVHGILQPVLGGSPGFEQTVKNREYNYNLARQANPKSAGLGELIGQIALSMPFFSGASALVSKVPGAAGQYLTKSPLAKSIAENALGGVLFGGAQYVNPEESRLENALTGGAIGGGLGVVAPYAGKAIGYGAEKLKQGYKGVRKYLGSEPHIAEELTSYYTPEEMQLALKNQMAAKRLGTSLTPAEASQSAIGAKREGKLGSSEKGERKYYEYKKQQKETQEKAIEGFLTRLNPKQKHSYEDIRNTAKKVISLEESALREKAEPFYQAAYNAAVSPNKLNSLLKKDGNVEAAFKKVTESPEFKREIEGYAANTVKVLDQVKKQLDDKISSALRKGEKEKARRYMKSKESLVKLTDEVSRDYKKGRSIYEENSPKIDLLRKRELGKLANLKDKDIKKVGNIVFDRSQTNAKEFARIRDELRKENPDAWYEMVSNEISKRIATNYEGRTGYHGSNFYRNILADKNTYNKFLDALKGDRKAQQNLKDMKVVFKELINEPTVKGAATQSKTSMSGKRQSLAAVKDFVYNMNGGKYDTAMVELITSPKWEDAFRKALDKYKNGEPKPLSELIEKISKQELGKKAVISAKTSTSGEPYMETENYAIY